MLLLKMLGWTFCMGWLFIMVLLTSREGVTVDSEHKSRLGQGCPHRCQCQWRIGLLADDRAPGSSAATLGAKDRRLTVRSRRGGWRLGGAQITAQLPSARPARKGYAFSPSCHQQSGDYIFRILILILRFCIFCILVLAYLHIIGKVLRVLKHYIFCIFCILSLLHILYISHIILPVSNIILHIIVHIGPYCFHIMHAYCSILFCIVLFMFCIISIKFSLHVMNIFCRLCIFFSATYYEYYTFILDVAPYYFVYLFLHIWHIFTGM
jgi:hypothetical protein